MIPSSRQIGPSQPTPRVEIINFQEQHGHAGHQDYQFETGPYDNSYGRLEDYNAYGTDNFHQDLDLDFAESDHYEGD